MDDLIAVVANHIMLRLNVAEPIFGRRARMVVRR
jgi:hypothetical protein